MVIPTYHIFKPQSVASIDQQITSCFNSLHHYLSRHSQQKAFILRFFVSANSPASFQQSARQINDRMHKEPIPFSIICQAPEKPHLVLLEAGFVDTDNVTVEYGQADMLKFCKLSVCEYEEYWFGASEGGTTINDTLQSSINAFNQLTTAFNKLGLSFNHIVRQWNYVEQIFGFKEIDKKTCQNYQLFNEVRNTYYREHRDRTDFPAATGIGAQQNGVTIECLLMRSDADLKIIPISNPQQLNSYKYGQTVLKGDPAGERNTNQAPQFERAKLVTNGKSSRIFISGTASIIGQETIGIDDAEIQTRVTINNIELLTSKANLRAHCPELTVFPEKYAYLRVYVKQEEDIPKVKSICHEHFGDVPMTFVKADICRADLLVEIEGEKVS